MPSRRLKDAVYEQQSRLGKAVAAPKRLELLDLLSQAPRSVEALAGQAGISVANASQHLQVLRAARLVEAERSGLHVVYRLSDDDVGGFVLALRRIAESRLAEIRQTTRAYLERRGAMEAVIGGDEVLRRVKSGEVMLLDVRPPEEYRAGHIPGAVSVPVDELKARIKELRKDRTIVAYCRGPYCVMAVEAVELLRGRGFDARRMEEGVLEWRARGRRVASEPADRGAASGV